MLLCEAETSVRPSFSVTLGFRHRVFRWDVLRSDVEGECYSEPLLRTKAHQEKHFLEASILYNELF